ncbi:hypothetical protein [Acidocella aromatica]|uniref:Transposase n=1 Tax=Acidocella aromatica TaxID=1303579 RepID=A0A840VEX1_9PROT|nr:hypothetical protein [Acidocella aromatica]MBB5374236.1 hypothetical protein [Acidocella aromatica]
MFWQTKKADNGAAEIAELKRQLEKAKEQITQLLLERIQMKNEIELLKDYRGAPPQVVVRPVGIVSDISAVPAPANSQIGLLHTKEAG